jgi:hypothetical protein
MIAFDLAYEHCTCARPHVRVSHAARPAITPWCARVARQHIHLDQQLRERGDAGWLESRRRHHLKAGPAHRDFLWAQAFGAELLPQAAATVPHKPAAVHVPRAPTVEVRRKIEHAVRCKPALPERGGELAVDLVHAARGRPVVRGHAGNLLREQPDPLLQTALELAQWLLALRRRHRLQQQPLGGVLVNYVGAVCLVEAQQQGILLFAELPDLSHGW